jgi:hypothetical protein
VSRGRRDGIVADHVEQRHLSRPQPSRGNSHLLGHTILTAVMLAVVAALAISLLLRPPCPAKVTHHRPSGRYEQSAPRFGRSHGVGAIAANAARPDNLRAWPPT